MKVQRTAQSTPRILILNHLISSHLIPSRTQWQLPYPGFLHLSHSARLAQDISIIANQPPRRPAQATISPQAASLPSYTKVKLPILRTLIARNYAISYAWTMCNLRLRSRVSGETERRPDWHHLASASSWNGEQKRRNSKTYRDSLLIQSRSHLGDPSNVRAQSERSRATWASAAYTLPAVDLRPTDYHQYTILKWRLPDVICVRWRRAGDNGLGYSSLRMP